MAYSKQTWDTTSYVNPTRMNHIEQGIEDANAILDRIAVLTGTLASNGFDTGNNYPTGFNNNNTIVLSLMMQEGGFYWKYQDLDSPPSRLFVQLGNNIQVYNNNANFSGKPYKILIMKQP